MTTSESRNPERKRLLEAVTEQHDAKDAYVLALEAIEHLFIEQRARIAAEIEQARAAAEKSDFEDHRNMSRAASRAAQISWEADEQIAGLKQRLDELYQERVVKPIMEARQLSSEMEKRNRHRFHRRVGDVPR